MMSLALGVAALLVGETSARGLGRALDIFKAQYAEMEAKGLLPPATAGHATKNLRAHNLTSYANCGTDSYTAQNLVVGITPDPPTAGAPVTTTYDYYLSKEITGGKATYKVTYNGIPFPNTVDDLCVDQAGGVQPDPCPMAVGQHADKSISDFPTGLSGKIVMTTTWTDQDSANVLCVKWTVQL